MGCFNCAKLNNSEKNAVKYYKNLYDTKGLETIVYKVSSKDSFKIVRKTNFNDIYETQVQPNFKNGAEFYLIQEFRGN